MESQKISFTAFLSTWATALILIWAGSLFFTLNSFAHPCSDIFLLDPIQSSVPSLPEDPFPIERYFPNMRQVLLSGIGRAEKITDIIPKGSRAYILWRQNTPGYIDDTAFIYRYLTSDEVLTFFDSRSTLGALEKTAAQAQRDADILLEPRKRVLESPKNESGTGNGPAFPEISNLYRKSLSSIRSRILVRFGVGTWEQTLPRNSDSFRLLAILDPEQKLHIVFLAADRNHLETQEDIRRSCPGCEIVETGVLSIIIERTDDHHRQISIEITDPFGFSRNRNSEESMRDPIVADQWHDTLKESFREAQHTLMSIPQETADQINISWVFNDYIGKRSYSDTPEGPGTAMQLGYPRP